MNLRRLFHDTLARFNIVLAPVQSNRLMWLEVVAITLAAMGLSLVFQRDNPFHIGGEFPWIWLAPVLIALRYAVVPGIVSSLMLIAAWKLRNYLGDIHEGFPEQYFLGGLILTMLCGEFSASWMARLRRAEETNRYLDERMSRITLRHLLLRLSHDRLEQEILTKPVTLRDALSGLRELTAVKEEGPMPASTKLLQLLTQYCQLESAAIFISRADGKYHRISEIGIPPALNENDPLLLHALEERALSHLLVAGVGDQLPSPFLVVAPIITSGNTVLGMLAIDRMPFLALNDENLQMLSVMLGYYADCVNEADGVRHFQETFPSAPTDFAAEFFKLQRLRRIYGINSQIVALSFNDDQAGRQAVGELTRIRRGLDISWQIQSEQRILLLNLMPLSNEVAVEGYLLRIDTMLTEYMGQEPTSWHLAPVRISLEDEDPLGRLRQLIEGRHD